MTVIVVTHRSSLIQQMDRMLVLEAGRVQQLGPVAEVMQTARRADPASQVVVAMPRHAAGA